MPKQPSGPWWWSNGQRARLLLQRSKFRSCIKPTYCKILQNFCLKWKKYQKEPVWVPRARHKPTTSCTAMTEQLQTLVHDRPTLPTMYTQALQVLLKSFSLLKLSLVGYLPTNLPTYQPTYLPTNQPTYLPTYLPTYQLTNLPTSCRVGI